MLWNVPPDVLPGSVTVVYVLDRLLNGCVKHAFKHMQTLTVITIKAKTDADHCKVYGFISVSFSMFWLQVNWTKMMTEAIMNQCA